MPASEPGQLINIFSAFFNSGDLEGLATLYQEEVIFGQSVKG